MRHKPIVLAAVLSLVCAAALCAQSPQPLQLVRMIPLPEVEGRIDHFSIDLAGRRLFMSALGNNTVEVFDLRANRRLHSITGLDEPQGVTYAPASRRLFVANGGDGTVRIFDASTYRQLRVVRFSSDADDTRYDAATRRVYVGYGTGAIAAMDAATGEVLGEIRLDGHPEAYEVAPGGGRIYVNVPASRRIAVADWARKAVVARWRLLGYAANFPMALDAARHRLFVVTRRIPQLLVFDTVSGRMVANLDTVGDADDIWYDARRRRIYVTGGQGFIGVFEQRDADHYRPLARIPTATGARTSFFSPVLGRLYVAVPRRGLRRAQLRIYAAP